MAGERADVVYVRIPHLTVMVMESRYDSALVLLQEASDSFVYGAVKKLESPAPSPAPMLSLAGMPDLRVYGSLLAELA